MVKKVICQSNDSNKKHQYLNTSSIKALRPKVYITDSSSFKALVQQLTGNGNGHRVPIPVPSDASPIIEIPDHEVEDNRVIQENSIVEFSFDSSKFVLPATTDQQFDISGFGEIESWLMEVDQFPDYYDVYAPTFRQEVCVHDYELSGLLY